MSDDHRVREAAERLTKALADQGLIIAAGWQTYRLLCLRLLPHETREDLQEAWMASAEHLFSCMVSMLDPGVEETDADLRRMDRLHEELKPIRQTLKLKYGRTAGSA